MKHKVFIDIIDENDRKSTLQFDFETLEFQVLGVLPHGSKFRPHRKEDIENLEICASMCKEVKRKGE